MKKIIYLIFILNLISISIARSDDFLDYYPEQADIIINLNIDESKEYLSWAKDSMMDKTYNEVLSSLKEKISVDISKDIEELRICFINVKMGFMDNSIPFFFIKGNFKNYDSWHRLINSLAEGTTNEEAKITKLTINGSEKMVFTAGDIQFIQLSDNIMFIGIKGSSNLIERKNITFVKAPNALIKLSKQAKSYAYFSKKNLWKIIFLKNLFYESKHFISVSAYIKDNMINLIGNLDDPNVVEEETKIFKEDINTFYNNYKHFYQQEKKLLRETPLNYFPIIAKRTYLDALYKKIIDNIKVTNNEDSIIVSLPFEKYLIKHIILNLADTGTFLLNLRINNNVLSACIANQKILAKALGAYNKNDNSDLHYDFDFRDKDEKNEQDEYYTNKKIKERIIKPNQTGKTTMIIDVETLLKNDCLDIEPVKPDPECEYIAYRKYNLNDYNVYCLKHSFCVPRNRTDFGGIFRGGAYDPGFLNPGKKQILNSLNCYNNQRQLVDSVNKYNKTKELKMKKLDISELIKSGILEKAPMKTDFRCDYYSEGDLSSDEGCIYCKIHGPESYKIGNKQSIEDAIALRNIKLSKVDFDTVDRKEIKTIKRCYLNLGMITGAIIRNNEKENSIKIATDLNIADMLEKKMIWGDPKKNNPDCEYYIEGDMTKEGHVVCKKHGYITE